jgi:bidirectional [NiFe] hydrogenase diaphorase subunit
MVTITIDGKEIAVEEGLTLLEAAKRLGIEIPTLCYHEALGPYGACRICMVQIEYGTRLQLVTACTYPAWDGLKVKTDTERVREARRFSMELLLARSPNVKEIQDMAERLGVQSTELEKTDEECILCGLCVRVCSDIIGKSAISFVDRGTERRVETPFNTQSEDCIGCGACHFICPTGAIKMEDIQRFRKIHGNTELELSRCRVCDKEFVTLKELEHVKGKVDIPLETLELCPRCRRKKTGRDIGAAKPALSSV